jgi:hypothetical protein
MRRIVIAALLGLLSLSMWSGSAFAVASVPVAVSVVPQDPGPSAALFAAPYYKCQTNYYVSTSGSDSAAGTSGAPWATLNHANASGKLAAGACVNVAPGTYSAGLLATVGGNAASSTGYVTYRCQTLDGCTITDPGNQAPGSENAAFAIEANYVIIDGFRFAASSYLTDGNAVSVQNGTNNFTFTQHHIWALNNIVTGYGQGGFLMAEGEYFYAVHNTLYANAGAVSCNGGAQGSGIGINQPITASGYTPTADDLNNPIVGNVGNAFHIFVEWNVTYNNYEAPCTTSANNDTDGNGIIADTWLWSSGQSGSTAYTGGGLFAFNVSYANGGAGLESTNSSGVTFANNSCYNNYLDPYNGGATRGCINSTGSYGSYSNTFINNLAVAIPTTPYGGTCSYTEPPAGQGPTSFNSAIVAGLPSAATAPDGYTFSNNVTELLGTGTSCWGPLGIPLSPTAEASMFNGLGSYYSTTANIYATNPLWVSVGGTATGTESTPPNGVNFALQSTSRAIGYGLTETYLPATSVDAGACYHTLGSCP